jgi:hypothetical protein
VARFAIDGVIPFITLQRTRTTLRRNRFPWQSTSSMTNSHNTGPASGVRIVARVTDDARDIDAAWG